MGSRAAAREPQHPVPMRVLVASDGSERARIVVDLVAAVDWPAGSTIELIGAVESTLVRFGGAWPTDMAVDNVRLDEQMRLVLAQELERERDRLARPGLGVESRVILGRAADVILDRAVETASDLIIVGSRGHGGLQSMLLGSVSAEIIDHAPAPVLVARRPAVERVLLAWDGSTGAELAAACLVQWPIFADSRIRVLTVDQGGQPEWLGPGFATEGDVEAARAAAAASAASEHERVAGAMAERLREAGLHADHERREGDPATEIVAVAAEQEADLIVMGTHGRTGLRRLLLGSVARNVLHHATSSVLAVREEAPPKP